jgi:hypothetical protein
MIMQSLNMFALITIFFTPIYASLEPRQVYLPPPSSPFPSLSNGKVNLLAEPIPLPSPRQQHS